MWLRIWAWVVLLALAACASGPPPVTVQGAAPLALPAGQPMGLRLDERAPRARFEGLDSAFALFALPPTAGPLWIELRSLPLDGGSALAQALLPPPWRAYAAFAPVLDLLDAQGRVLRSVDADALWETGCAPPGQPPLRWPLAVTGVLVDPRAEGAVLLRVRTSEAVRSLRPRRYCDEGQRRWVDEARLELRLASFAGPLAPDAQAFPLLRRQAGPSVFDVSVDWAWMLVSGGAVRLASWEGKQAASGGEPWPLDELLDFRRESLRSGSGFSVLRLPPGQEPVRQHFDAPPALSERLQALLPADRLALWQVQFEVQPVDPPVAIRFEAEPAGSAPAGAMARIRDLAGAGGILVASPCGVCAAGVCGPEMLGPCAAAFGAGAVIGGAVGLVKEAAALLLPGRKAEKQAEKKPETAREPPPPELVARLGALPARWFPAGSLEVAYARALPELPDGLWLSRPWAALPTVGAAGGGALRCSVAVRIAAVAFERPARADSTAFRVRMHVEHRLACDGRERAVDRSVLWSGSYREPEVWLDPSSVDTHQDLQQLEAEITSIGLRWAEARWGDLVQGLGGRRDGR